MLIAPIKVRSTLNGYRNVALRIALSNRRMGLASRREALNEQIEPPD